MWECHLRGSVFGGESLVLWFLWWLWFLFVWTCLIPPRPERDKEDCQKVQWWHLGSHGVWAGLTSQTDSKRNVCWSPAVRCWLHNLKLLFAPRTWKKQVARSKNVFFASYDYVFLHSLLEALLISTEGRMASNLFKEGMWNHVRSKTLLRCKVFGNIPSWCCSSWSARAEVEGISWNCMIEHDKTSWNKRLKCEDQTDFILGPHAWPLDF